jgi:ribonuclease HII
MADLEIERAYGGKIIVGVDEAGRGPLAGPVVAAAVIVDQNNIIKGIRDSKKISKKKREILYDQIINSYKYAVGVVSPAEIDQINILQATIKACKMSVSGLSIEPEIVLVDGNMKFDDTRFYSIVKGDDKSLSIAAASIVAKVTRDRIMEQLSSEFPNYSWVKNSGYGTSDHLEAIKKFGRTKHHRVSFKVKGIDY